MRQPVLEIRDLDKHFGELHVTQRISLSVSRGECLALIGPNGAGKTTLVHQLSGLLRPESGLIRLGGRDVTALPMHRRARAGLGRSFQLTSLLPSMTVLENVALAAQATEGTSFRFFGNAAAETRLNERARDALHRVGFAADASRPVAALSHGEKRLLELAVALVAAPKALLLDEPMAGMGRQESAEMIETLRALKPDCAMLLVEHDMNAVFKLADRVAVLVAGAVVAEGTPDEVRRNPVARAAYLGEDEIAPC